MNYREDYNFDKVTEFSKLLFVAIILFCIFILYYYFILKFYSKKKPTNLKEFWKKIFKYISYVKISRDKICIKNFKIIGMDTYSMLIFSKLSLIYLFVIFCNYFANKYFFEIYFTKKFELFLIFIIFFIFIEHLNLIYFHLLKITSQKYDIYNSSIFIKFNDKFMEKKKLFIFFNKILEINDSKKFIKIIEVKNYTKLSKVIENRYNLLIKNKNFKRSYCFFKYFIHSYIEKRDDICLHILKKYNNKLNDISYLDYDESSNKKIYYIFFNNHEHLFCFLKFIEFKFNFNTYFIDYFQEKISVHPFIKPHNINWRNLHKNSKIKKIKRIFLILIILCILVFVSTPVVFLQLFEYTIIKNKFIRFDILHIIDVLPNFLKYLIMNYYLSFLLVISNNIILTIIDKIFKLYDFFKFSDYQIKIFQNSCVYIALNLLIIPSLSYSTYQSIYNIIKGGEFNFIKMIENLNNIGSYKFYYHLIMQTAIGQMIFNLTFLYDLISNKFSYTLVFIKRKNFYKHKWKKNIEDCFQLGYYFMLLNLYFSMIILFGFTDIYLICVVFSYIIIMSIVYWINNFFFYKEEVFTNGRLQVNVINFLNIIFFLKGIFIIVFVIVEQININSFAYVILIILLFLLKIFYWNKYQNKMNNVIKHQNDFNFKSILIRKWFNKKN